MVANGRHALTVLWTAVERRSMMILVWFTCLSTQQKYLFTILIMLTLLPLRVSHCQKTSFLMRNMMNARQILDGMTSEKSHEPQRANFRCWRRSTSRIELLAARYRDNQEATPFSSPTSCAPSCGPGACAHGPAQRWPPQLHHALNPSGFFDKQL